MVRVRGYHRNIPGRIMLLLGLWCFHKFSHILLVWIWPCTKWTEIYGLISSGCLCPLYRGSVWHTLVAGWHFVIIYVSTMKVSTETSIGVFHSIHTSWTLILQLDTSCLCFPLTVVCRKNTKHRKDFYCEGATGIVLTESTILSQQNHQG